MEVPDPEIPGTEEDIQKDQIQKVLAKQVAASDVLCFYNIYSYSYMLYITYVERTRKQSILFVSDIQYHKLPLLLVGGE